MATALPSTAPAKKYPMVWHLQLRGCEGAYMQQCDPLGIETFVRMGTYGFHVLSHPGVDMTNITPLSSVENEQVLRLKTLFSCV